MCKVKVNSTTKCSHKLCSSSHICSIEVHTNNDILIHNIYPHLRQHSYKHKSHCKITSESPHIFLTQFYSAFSLKTLERYVCFINSNLPPLHSSFGSQFWEKYSFFPLSCCINIMMGSVSICTNRKCIKYMCTYTHLSIYICMYIFIRDILTCNILTRLHPKINFDLKNLAWCGPIHYSTLVTFSEVLYISTH